jgi:peptidoglycan/LPS O-acetylase OafA/YrhL
MSGDASSHNPGTGLDTNHAASGSGKGSEASKADAGRASSRHIPSLDGLRAVAICLVLFGHLHCTALFGHGSLSFAISGIAHLGIKIFLVISGYLITHILVSELKKTGKVNILHFYVRRAFRIFPAAYAFMAVSFIVFGDSLTLTNKVLAVIFAENYSLHTQWNLGHLWSLGVQEQFYLLWPALFAVLPKHRITVLLIAICAVPFINVIIIRCRFPYWGYAFYSVADSIACGCLLALIRNWRRIDAIMRSRWFALIPILTCAAAPVANIAGGGVFFGLLKSLVIRPWLNIGIALSIEKAVRLAPKFLNLPSVSMIGAMSYSIYIWQQPIAGAPAMTSSFTLDLLIRLVAIGLCATGSYYLIEQPFIKLRKSVLVR